MSPPSLAKKRPGHKCLCLAYVWRVSLNLTQGAISLAPGFSRVWTASQSAGPVLTGYPAVEKPLKRLIFFSRVTRLRPGANEKHTIIEMHPSCPLTGFFPVQRRSNGGSFHTVEVFDNAISYLNSGLVAGT